MNVYITKVTSSFDRWRWRERERERERERQREREKWIYIYNIPMYVCVHLCKYSGNVPKLPNLGYASTQLSATSFCCVDVGRTT